MKVGELFAKLVLDDASYNQGIDSAEKRFQSLGDRLSAIGGTLTKAVTLPLAAIGVASTKMAMEAVESENLFEVAMGDMANAARKWSNQLSKSLGLNAYELRRNTGTFYTMFKSMGLGKQAAYDMSTGLTKLAYDMASFYNLNPEEAFEKLQAGITGEIEPLKRLGIVINDTTIKSYALSVGMIRQGQEMSEQQKVAARYALILQQTADAQGDLARTMDSPTNQLRVFWEQVKQTAVDLGMQLIPTLLSFLEGLKGIMEGIKGAVEWFAKLDAGTRNMIIGFALAAAAIGPLMIGIGALVAAIGTIGAPLAAVIAGVVLVGGALTGLALSQSRAVDTAKKHAQKLDEQRKSAEDMIDRLKYLTDGHKRTNKEEQEFIELQNQLADILPGAVKGYDDQHNAIIDLNAALRDLIRLKREEIKAEMDALKAELVVKRAKLEAAQAKQTKANLRVKRAEDNMASDPHPWMEDKDERIKQAQEELAAAEKAKKEAKTNAQRQLAEIRIQRAQSTLKEYTNTQEMYPGAKTKAQKELTEAHKSKREADPEVAALEDEVAGLDNAYRILDNLSQKSDQDIADYYSHPQNDTNANEPSDGKTKGNGDPKTKKTKEELETERNQERIRDSVQRDLEQNEALLKSDIDNLNDWRTRREAEIKAAGFTQEEQSKLLLDTQKAYSSKYKSSLEKDLKDHEDINNTDLENLDNWVSERLADLDAKYVDEEGNVQNEKELEEYSAYIWEFYEKKKLEIQKKSIEEGRKLSNEEISGMQNRNTRIDKLNREVKERMAAISLKNQAYGQTVDGSAQVLAEIDAEKQARIQAVDDVVEKWKDGQQEILNEYGVLITEQNGLDQWYAEQKDLIEQQMAAKRLEYLQSTRAVEDDLEVAKTQGDLQRYMQLLNDENAAKLTQLQGEQQLMDTYREMQMEANRSMNSYIAESAANVYSGLSGALADVVTGARSAKEAFSALGKQLIGMVIEFMVKRALAATMGKALEKAAVVASASSAAMTAAAWAPAAAMVSLASFGANSAPAMAGMAATSAMAGTLALIPMAQGGIVTGPTGALIGEGRYKEAVLPLDRDRLEKLGLGGGEGSKLINNNFYGDVNTEPDIDRLLSRIGETVENAMKGG